MFVSQFIRGKIIVNGEDKSGFTVVGKTSDIKDDLIERVHRYSSPGNTTTSPIFSLTEIIDGSFRVFSYHFMSSTRDKRRGSFRMSHNILLSDEALHRLFSLTSLAKQLINHNANRQFPEVEILAPLEIELLPYQATSKNTILLQYSNTVLEIVDSLFQSPTIVIDSSKDAIFRLNLSELIYSLLPTVLRNKIGVHTDVSTSAKMKTIESRLKFSSTGLMDHEGHQFVSIETNNNKKFENLRIRSSYVKLLHNLLSVEQMSFKHVVQLCQNLSSNHYLLDATDNRLANDLKDMLCLESFQSIINTPSKKIDHDTALFWERNHEKFSEEQTKIVCRKIWEFWVNDGKMNHSNMKEIISVMAEKLPNTFWDNLINHIILSPEKISPFTNILVSFPISVDNLWTASGKTLTQKWIEKLFDLQSFDLIKTIYHKKDIFPITEIDKLNYLQSAIINGTNDDHFLIELIKNAYYSETQEGITNILSSQILTKVSDRHPILSDLLRNIVYGKRKYQAHNLLENVKQETNDLLFLWTGLLSLRLGCDQFLNTPFFFEIVQSNNTEIQNNFDVSLFKSKRIICDETLGALSATLFLLRDTIPSSILLSNSINNISKFIRGIHFTIETLKDTQQYKENQINLIASELAKQGFIPAVEFFIILAEVSELSAWKTFAFFLALHEYENRKDSLKTKKYALRLLKLHNELYNYSSRTQEIIKIIKGYLYPDILIENDFFVALEEILSILNTKLAFELILQSIEEIISNRPHINVNQKNAIWKSFIMWIVRQPSYQVNISARNAISRSLNHIQFNKLKKNLAT